MSQETSPELQALQAKGAQPSTHVFSNRKGVRQEVLNMAGMLTEEQQKKTQEEMLTAIHKPTLNEKIALISKSVSEIKRRGRNSDQGYKFLRIDDTVNAVRPAIEAQGLLLTGDLVSTDTVPDPKGITFKVEMIWTLEDLDSGESRTWKIPGAGWDYHDKGLYKAITGSRKYAYIVIFNLPIGDEPEASQAPDRESAKAAQRNVVQKKLIEAAGKGNQTAIDALSQIEPEKKVLIGRPDEYHAHYIKVSGFLAVPAIDQFLLDTAAKRFQTKTPPITVYWRLGADYEKGLIALCQKLGLEVEG